MNTEIYDEWRPFQNAPRRLNLAHFSHADVGIVVSLQENLDHGPSFTLLFESPVAYRNINESYRLRTWLRLSGEKERSSLQCVRNSEWINWLRQEAGGVLDGVALHHYAIFTDEDSIDVVTEFAPTVSQSL